MGARLAVARQDERFAVTASGWHVPQTHLAPIKAQAAMISSPWPSSFSARPICGAARPRSASIARAWCRSRLQAAGIACPRDSDMQELALGKLSSLADLRRGDLVFWKGHVAIARNAEELIHANAHHMMVAVEPVAEAIRRIKAAGSEVTSVKRL